MRYAAIDGSDTFTVLRGGRRRRSTTRWRYRCQRPDDREGALCLMGSTPAVVAYSTASFYASDIAFTAFCRTCLYYYIEMMLPLYTTWYYFCMQAYFSSYKYTVFFYCYYIPGTFYAIDDTCNFRMPRWKWWLPVYAHSFFLTRGNAYSAIDDMSVYFHMHFIDWVLSMLPRTMPMFISTPCHSICYQLSILLTTAEAVVLTPSIFSTSVPLLTCTAGYYKFFTVPSVIPICLEAYDWPHAISSPKHHYLCDYHHRCLPAEVAFLTCCITTPVRLRFHGDTICPMAPLPFSFCR